MINKNRVKRSPVIGQVDKKNSKFQRVFRALGKTAGLGLLAGSVALGVREGVNARSSAVLKQREINRLVQTDSGRRAAKVYVMDLNRRDPKFAENVKSRVYVLGILEKKLSGSKKIGDLTVSRAMYTLERSTLHGPEFVFNAGQIRGAKNERVRHFYEVFNSLAPGVRKDLFELSRIKGTLASIEKQAEKDGYDRFRN
jgi:hypothetical protein